MHGRFDVWFLLLLMVYGGYVAIFLTGLQTHPSLMVFISSMPGAENLQIPFLKWLYIGWVLIHAIPVFLGFSWVELSYTLWLFKRSFWPKFNFHHLLTRRESSGVMMEGKKTGIGDVSLQKQYQNIAILPPRMEKILWRKLLYCSINLKKMSFQIFFWRGW